MYKVYVQVDAFSRITAINSDTFLTDLTDWVQIDSGSGDKYHHAQGNYLDEPIMTEHGKRWLSMVENNTWEPGADGVFDSIWKEIV